MKFLSVITLLTMFLSACSAVEEKKYVTLSYSDFGPPSLASELLGAAWWQWQEHGDSRPRDYDIQVVVYRDMNTDEIARLFPVDESKEQDYRYIAYLAAIGFLDSNISELEQVDDEVIQGIKDQLLETKRVITENLGPPSVE